MRRFLAELGFPQTDPIVFYTDSASAIDLGELFRDDATKFHTRMH